MALYKSERDLEVARELQIKETVTKARRIAYPVWTLMFIINGLLVIGYYYQDKLIVRNSKKLANRERLRAN